MTVPPAALASTAVAAILNFDILTSGDFKGFRLYTGTTYIGQLSEPIRNSEPRGTTDFMTIPLVNGQFGFELDDESNNSTVVITTVALIY